MTIVFENPLDNPLAPHHYIEFTANQPGSGLQGQNQILLVIDLVKELPAADKLPKNMVFSLAAIKEKKFELTADLKLATESALMAYPEVNLAALVSDSLCPVHSHT